ncbi:hypothetical protein DENSPDRAFT_840926 [Dentipellis sp. KUC8613]|nr:hypothetical protein DENSPDRAFT_840926 [Dentipellis sp. KUC8613]
MPVSAESSDEDDSDYTTDNSESSEEPQTVKKYKPRAAPRTSSVTRPPPKLRPWKVGGNSRPQKFPYWRENGKLSVSWSLMHGLNMHRDYGKSRSSSSTWGSAAGVRELVQNLFDAILDVRHVLPHQIRVEEFHKGKSIVGSTSDTELPLNSESVELFLYDTSIASASDEVSEPVGYVAWKPSLDKPGFGDLELYNVGSISYSSWYLGGTSKGSKPHLIGQYGDGLKIGINALMREEARVLYHTKHQIWVFGYLRDHLLFFKKKSRRNVNGVLVQVRNIPWNSLGLDRFLFLRPPKEILCSDKDTGWTKGCVLLDERHRSHIYVKGILVRLETDQTTGLVYGINIAGDISMSRDRSALEDRSHAAEAVFNIWQPLLLTSDDTRIRYLALLKDHERALDVEGIKGLSPACAKVLLATLREQHVDNAFFYHAQETSDERHVIEEYLHKEPVLISKTLYHALRAHKTIMTPMEAQKKMFHSLTPVQPDEVGSLYVKHVIHSFRALLHLDTRTLRFLSSYSFKSAHFDNLEISVMGDEIHLSANLLNSEYVHRKPGPDACSIGQPNEDEDTSAEVIYCDCASLLIVTCLADEIKASQSNREQLKFLQRLLIAQMPRNLRHVFSVPSVVTVSWSTLVAVSGPRGFRICVEEHVPNIPLDGELVYKPGPDVDGEINASQHRTSSGPSIILSDLTPGTRYRVRVCTAPRNSKAAIWSSPLDLTIPPLPVTGFLFQSLSSGSAHIQWDAAPGAARYSLALLGEDGEIVDEHEHISECCWDGQVNEARIHTIRITSCSSDGVSCLEPFEGAARNTPIHPEPSKEQTRSTSVASSSPVPPHVSSAGSQEQPPPPRRPSPSVAARTRSPVAPQRDSLNVSPVPSTSLPRAPWRADSTDGMSFGHADAFSDSDSDAGMEADANHNLDNGHNHEDIYQRNDAETDTSILTRLQTMLSTLFGSRESQGSNSTSSRVPQSSSSHGAARIRSRRAYKFSIDGFRMAMFIHKVVSKSGTPTHVLATRYIFAAEYFKAAYGESPNSSGHELIKLLEPHGDPECGKFDYEHVLRCVEGSNFEKIKIRQEAATDTDGSPDIHYWSLLMSGDTKSETLTISNKKANSGYNASTIGTTTVVDLYAGCGGVARGFDAAGFNILAAVEEQVDAATSWQFNFPDAPVHAEDVQVFFDDVEAQKIAPPGPVTVLSMCAPLECSNDSKKMEHFTRMVERGIGLMKPALVCIFGQPAFLAQRYEREFHVMELKLLSKGYSISYRLLDIAEYGVAATSKRFVLLASAAGLPLPEWPKRTHGDPAFHTVRDAIQDLEWRNPRQPADASDRRRSVYCTAPDDQQTQEPSAYALMLGAKQDRMVSHHSTGWKGNSAMRPVADYDGPYPLPTGISDCLPRRHPKHTDEYLSPRELARIVSFPDIHRFSGSRYEQYAQITSAVPPLLSKAIATSILHSLRTHFPNHVLQSDGGQHTLKNSTPASRKALAAVTDEKYRPPVQLGKAGEKRQAPDENGAVSAGLDSGQLAKRVKLERD